MAYRGARKVREDIYSMFHGASDYEREEWGSVLCSGKQATVRQCKEASARYGCRQEVVGGNILWLDAKDNVAVMFMPVNECDLRSVRKAYATIQAVNCPLAYLITGKDGAVRYLYIASRKSYMQFGYWLGPAGAHPRFDPGGPPPAVSTELAAMFEDLTRTERNKCVRVMRRSSPNITSYLKRQSKRYGCTQKRSGAHILWFAGDGRPEAMFRVLHDPTRIAPFAKLYDAIRDLRPKVTFAIVQKTFMKNRDFDVFRLCAEDGYISHHYQLYVE